MGGAVESAQSRHRYSRTGCGCLVRMIEGGLMPGAFLGIDWGTHSSKWCYQDAAGKRVVGRIWDSRVWRHEDQLSIFPLRARFQAGQGEAALKRKLINDPDQPFWEGQRRRLGVSLGESVVFSLMSL